MSSNPSQFLSTSVEALVRPPALGLALLYSAAVSAAPLAAQDDSAKTPQAPPVEATTEATAPPVQDEVEIAEVEQPARINLSVTVPRGDVNVAQAQQCEDEADAGTISGDIIVCRKLGESGENYFSGSASEARKRYAQETAFKGSPSTPNVSGLSDNGKGISLGGVPPPALIIDVEALPPPPPVSDADRIARGLPPLGQDEDLSEEEIRKRREALGLPPPAYEKKRGN